MTLRTLGTNVASLNNAYVQLGSRTKHAPALGLYFPEAEGAVGDGTTDDTAAVQAAADKAATAKKTLQLDAVTYKISTKLGFSSHLKIIGQNGGAQSGAGTKILWAGSAGGIVCGPKNTTVDTINVHIQGVWFNGANTAGVGVSLYRTSYSRLGDVYVDGCDATTGVGFLFDANVSNQCYFNVADNCKASGAVGVRFQNGANANRWNGGKVGNGTSSMEFLSLSAGNVVSGADFETASVRHIHVDAASNVFLGNHMESAPIGFNWTTNSGDSREFGTTFASSVTTYQQDARTTIAGSVALGRLDANTVALDLEATRIKSAAFTTGTTIDVDPRPYSGTANLVVNWFRNVTTTGARQFILYNGDGTGNYQFFFDVKNKNAFFGGNNGGGSAVGVLAIGNRTTPPSTAPVSGGVLYSESGSLRWVTSSQTFRTIGGDVVAQSSTATASVNGNTVLATAGAGGITVQLPAAVKGSEFVIKKVDSGAGAVTVSTSSSQTIDGASTKSLAAQWNYIRVVSDGTSWFVVGNG